MRTVSGVFALVLVAFAAAGCSAEPSDATGDSTAAVTNGTDSVRAAAPNADLIAHLKAAYEAAPMGTNVLTDAKDVAWSTLAGEAREAYNEYASSASWGLMMYVGSPIAQAGTFEGKTLYFVAGDLSDTGSEWGFYDELFNALAVAYGGQGEHPGPGGVDWEK